MECLKDFIKYNIRLIHLDLTNTGLTYAAIVYIGMILTRAQSLRCLHLCGNPGLTSYGEEGLNVELERFLRKRIRAKPRVVNYTIPLFKDEAVSKYVGK